MDKSKLNTPKGFRDYLPQDALKRQFLLEKIVSTFQKFGFDPLETPTLEYAETLKGKYGEEEKLIYEFTTRGGDQVALRYDQTVPLARVVAQYPELPKPFKRYQIQSAYRGENPQKWRQREFLQCDADIVGSSTPLADAEILALVYEIYKKLGVEVVIAINDRSILKDIESKYLSAIDKLEKIGPEKVKEELTSKGLSSQQAEELFNQIAQAKEPDSLKEIRKIFSQMGYPQEKLVFYPTMVRGLDYYTGMIVEARLEKMPSVSLGGGGRFDQLIGKFCGQDLPAVGFSVGLDRTLEALEEAGILSAPSTSAKVLVTIFSLELTGKSLEVSSKLRTNNINAEIWLDPNSKLDKQLKYADLKGIPYVIIIGPEEAEKNLVTLKNLSEKTQIQLPLDEVIQKLSS